MWQEGLKDQWSRGNFQSEDPMVSLQANAQAIGEVRQLQLILDLDAKQITEVLTDEDE